MVVNVRKGGQRPRRFKSEREVGCVAQLSNILTFHF